MTVNLSDTEEIELLWAALTSGRVSYGTYAEIAVALGRPYGSLAEVTNDAGTHTDPVTSTTVANEGVYRLTEVGWTWVRDLPENIETTTEGYKNAALAAQSAAENAAQIAGALMDVVPYATWTKLNLITGTSGDMAVVLSGSGTHTDPVTSLNVPDQGLYEWTTGWQRIGDHYALIAKSWADSAEGFSNAAETARNDAQAFAIAAETAQQIVEVQENYYATRAAGAIATPDGQLFVSDEGGTLAWYRATGGSYVLVSDVLSGAAYLKRDGTLDMTGKLTFATSTDDYAQFRMVAGVEPDDPEEGDVWRVANTLHILLGGVLNRFAMQHGTAMTGMQTDSTIRDRNNLDKYVGFRGVPVVARTAATPIIAVYEDCLILNTTGGWQIPANSSLALPVGFTAQLYNDSASAQSITITSDTLRQAGTTNTGTRTLAARGLCVIEKIKTTEWLISGVGLT